MITLIKGRLANNTDSGLDSIIIAEANMVQDKLEVGDTLPWFLFTDTEVAGTNLATVAGTETVALPSDFLRESEDHEHVLFSQDMSATDPWVPVKRDDYTFIKARWTGSGRPKHYDILGTNLYLRQIPDAAYVLRMLYMKRDADIVAGSTENLWMQYAGDLILAETGFIIATQYVIMPDVAQAFASQRSEARSRLQIEMTARVEAGRMRSMGED